MNTNRNTTDVFGRPAISHSTRFNKIQQILSKHIKAERKSIPTFGKFNHKSKNNILMLL